MPVRIYQNMPLSSDTLVTLDEKASHHVGRVLRLQIDDELILFNGQGKEYIARITHITKQSVQAHVHALRSNHTESPVSIVLAQGIARGEKMDFIVQKAVELGATQIVPLVTARSNVRLEGDRSKKRIEHWQAIAIHAAEQSGRSVVPLITPIFSLTAWLQQNPAGLRFVLSPHVSEKLPQNPADLPSSITILIGPEGGLSEPEIDQAVQQGFKPLNVGPRVLRTETASIVALSLLQARFGDL